MGQVISRLKRNLLQHGCCCPSAGAPPLSIRPLPIKFEHAELAEMTDNFSFPVGKGGSGSVFSGKFTYHGAELQVAVKRVEGDLEDASGGDEGEAQFCREMTTIASMRHSNLARLLGYCYVPEMSHRYLVYEFMSNGSLDRWIFKQNEQGKGKEQGRFLDWPARYQVAIDVARALSYMHTDCSSVFLHLDVKPENVLLDDGFRARLSDFGLSRVVKQGYRWVKTRGGGTLAYMPSEYLLNNNQVSPKADVYSFGMMLLELIRGERNTVAPEAACETSTSKKVLYPKLVMRRLEGDGGGVVGDIVDQRLTKSAEALAEMRDLLRLAIWCIQENPKKRYNMSKVVNYLERRCRDIPMPPETRTMMLDVAVHGPEELQNCTRTGLTQEAAMIDGLATVQTIPDLAALRLTLHGGGGDAAGSTPPPPTMTTQQGNGTGGRATIEELAWLPREFSYDELAAATGGFQSVNSEGSSFGSIFAGILDGGRKVVVKRLAGGVGAGAREFERKISVVTGMQHETLLHILGYCIAPQGALVVYDVGLAENGTMDKWIYEAAAAGGVFLGSFYRVLAISSIFRVVQYLNKDCNVTLDGGVIALENFWLDKHYVPCLMGYDDIILRPAGGGGARSMQSFRDFGKLVMEMVVGAKLHDGLVGRVAEGFVSNVVGDGSGFDDGSSRLWMEGVVDGRLLGYQDVWRPELAGAPMVKDAVALAGLLLAVSVSALTVPDGADIEAVGRDLQSQIGLCKLEMDTDDFTLGYDPDA